MSRFLQFDNVAFSYPGMAEPLLSGVTAHFPEGAWTGIVGANGAGKTTLLKLAAGELAPTEGYIRQIGSARYAVQRTDAPPDDRTRLTCILAMRTSKSTASAAGLSSGWHRRALDRTPACAPRPRIDLPCEERDRTGLSLERSCTRACFS